MDNHPEQQWRENETDASDLEECLNFHGNDEQMDAQQQVAPIPLPVRIEDIKQEPMDHTYPTQEQMITQSMRRMNQKINALSEQMTTLVRISNTRESPGKARRRQRRNAKRREKRQLLAMHKQRSSGDNCKSTHRRDDDTAKGGGASPPAATVPSRMSRPRLFRTKPPVMKHNVKHGLLTKALVMAVIAMSVIQLGNTINIPSMEKTSATSASVDATLGATAYLTAQAAVWIQLPGGTQMQIREDTPRTEPKRRDQATQTGTTELVEESPLATTTIPLHKWGDGLWHSSQGIHTVQLIPFPLHTGNFSWKPFTFQSPALYHGRSANGMLQWHMLSDYVTRTLQLERRLSRVKQYLVHKSFDSTVLSATLEGLGSGVEHSLHGLGEFWLQVSNMTYSGIENMLSGPLQVCVNLIVVVSMLTIILTVVYFILSTHCSNKFCKTKHNRLHAFRLRRALKRKRINVSESSVDGDQTKKITLNSFWARSREICSVCIPINKDADADDTVDPSNSSDTSSERNDDSVSEDSCAGTSKDESVCSAKLSCYQCTLETLIGGVPIVTLLDSGATVSLLSAQVARVLNCDIDKDESVNLTSMSGHKLKVIGRTVTDIRIGHQQYRNHSMLVVEGLDLDCVLGFDFMPRLGPVEFRIGQGGKGRLIIADDEAIPIGAAKTDNRKLFWPVTIETRVEIPGRTESILPVRINTKIVPPNKLLFEGCTLIQDKTGLMIGSGVVSVKCDGAFSIKVCNSLSAPIVLYAGMTLGFVEPISEEQIRAISASDKAPLYLAEGETLDSRWQKLKDHVDLSESDLSDDEKTQFLDCLKNHCDVIAVHDYDLGRTDLLEFDVDLVENTKPIARRPYREPYEKQQIINKYVNELIEHKLVIPYDSEFASPVLMVQKPESGKWRFVVDYSKLNAHIKAQHFPLPLIDTILSNVPTCSLMSSLDLLSGFWQIGASKQAMDCLAFVTSQGSYTFTVLPQGCSNGPSVYQKFITMVLGNMMGTSVHAYIDDILIMSESFTHHLEHLSEVLSRLRAAKLRIKLRKCNWAKRRLPFLGHVISEKGLQPCQQKTQAIKDFPVPNNVKELRSYLGISSYYRRYIRNYSIIAAPLFSLLRKEVKFNWTAACQRAFDTLKDTLVSDQVLAMPNYKLPFVIETDASLKGYGAACYNEGEDGQLRVISYQSRSLTPAEQKLPCIELECGAIAWAVQKFRQIIYGHRVKVLTDHMPLKYLLKSQPTTERMSKWVCALQTADIDIVYRSGKTNAVADALSRFPVSPPEGHGDIFEVGIECKGEEKVCALSLDSHNSPDLIRMQRADFELRRMIDYLLQR